MPRNQIVIKGKIRAGDEMIPFKIVWLVKADIYELECESATHAHECQFYHFKDALEYLVENYGSWSA